MNHVLKKTTLALVSATLFGLALTDAQPASADCGKMVIVYYSWPTPPPPPPQPQPQWWCGPTWKPIPRSADHVFRNKETNKLVQESGRDSKQTNLILRGNGNFINLGEQAGRVKDTITTLEDKEGYVQLGDWGPFNSDSINQSEWEKWIEAQSDSAGGVSPGEVDTGFALGPDDIFAEPNQQGVLAWNGRSDNNGEEILILSTNEKVLLPNKAPMLSILPLPGLPISVERANVKSFVTAKAFMQEKLANQEVEGGNLGVVLETKIGSHNIFVWKVESANDFNGKVQAYIADKYKGKAAAVISPETIKVINEYLKDGFEYFAFDLTVVENEFSTKEAIAYRFKSKYAYFPLRISKVGGTGKTSVDLVVLTPCEKLSFSKRSRECVQQGKDVGFMNFGPVDFSANELDAIDKSLNKIFNGAQHVLGRTISFTTKNIDSFDADFEMVDISNKPQ